MRKLILIALISLLFTPMVFAADSVTTQPANSKLDTIVAEYSRVINSFGEEFFYAYNLYSGMTAFLEKGFPNKDFDEKLINGFIEKIPSPKNNSEKEAAGAFISAMINTSKHNSFMLRGKVHEFDAVGYQLGKEKAITVEGSTGDYLGEKMTGGYIEVLENAGHSVGKEMTTGSILIRKNASDNVGNNMNGGSIIVDGDVESKLADSMDGGKIIVKGNAGSNLGFLMSGGEVVVHGNVDSLSADLGYNAKNQPLKIFLVKASKEDAAKLVDDALAKARKILEDGDKPGWIGKKNITIYSGVQTSEEDAKIYPSAKHKADEVAVTIQKAAPFALERLAGERDELKLTAKATGVIGEVELLWTRVEDADYYIAYAENEAISVTPVDKSGKILNNMSQTNFSSKFTGLPSNPLVFSVIAFKGDSLPVKSSNMVRLALGNQAITGFTLKAERWDNDITSFEWNHIKPAASYDLMIFDGANEKLVATVSASHNEGDPVFYKFKFKDKGLDITAFNTFVVVAKDNGGKAVGRSNQIIFSSRRGLKQPEDPSATGLKLEVDRRADGGLFWWKNTEPADRYDLKVLGDNERIVDSVDASSKAKGDTVQSYLDFADNDLDLKAFHTFVVVAKDKDGKSLNVSNQVVFSSWSGYKPQEGPLLSVVEEEDLKISAEATGKAGEVKVSWEGIKGVDYYVAYVVDEGIPSDLGTASNTINGAEGSFSYTFKDLPAKTLVFNVIAYKQSVYAVNSNYVKLLVEAADEEKLVLTAEATEKAGEIKLKWNAFPDAGYYNIECSFGPGESVKRDNVKELELIIGGLGNEQYVCKVTAFKADETKLTESDTVTVTPRAEPEKPGPAVEGNVLEVLGRIDEKFVNQLFGDKK